MAKFPSVVERGGQAKSEADRGAKEARLRSSVAIWITSSSNSLSIATTNDLIKGWAIDQSEAPVLCPILVAKSCAAQGLAVC